MPGEPGLNASDSRKIQKVGRRGTIRDSDYDTLSPLSVFEYVVLYGLTLRVKVVNL